MGRSAESGLLIAGVFALLLIITGGTMPTNIRATVFGGAGDRERSAYDGHFIGNTEMVVALPAHLPTAMRKVRVTNRANGKSAVAVVHDVGPWNTNDPYWEHPDGRPQAESGRDHFGRRTNHAGIDLSPALARTIGVDGMGQVDWEFVHDTAAGGSSG